MKIKRFIAADMRQAIRTVGKDLGPDAVILSNKTIDEGIELIAAIDFDESLFYLNKEQKSQEKEKEKPVEMLSQHNVKDTNVSTDRMVKNVVHGNAYLEKNDTQKDDAEKNDIEKLEAVLDAIKPKKHSTYVSTDVNTDVRADVRADAALHNIQDAVLHDMQNVALPSIQDTALHGIQKELSDLKGLLENQLAEASWSDATRRNPHRNRLTRHLVELGLSQEISRQIAEKIPDDIGFKNAWPKALVNLAQQVPVFDYDLIDKGGVIALLGTTGVGKTTTIAKLAARYALKHGRKYIALVTTDNYRIGAHEQLRTYGRILGIPIHTVSNQTEMDKVFKNLRDKDLVLIDTVGMGQRDVRLFKQIDAIRDSIPSVKNLLVLSATTQQSALEEIVTNYKHIKLDGCILTKVDEATRLGGAISAVIKHNLPVAYLTNGQKVPEDLSVAQARNLVSRSISTIQQAGQTAVGDSLDVGLKGLVLNANV